MTMIKIEAFLIAFLSIGWVFAYSMSGKNQRRALLGIGKIGALIVIAVIVISMFVLI